MNLENTKAIVTGVSKGIGLATVKDLISKGAIVAGWGRSAPPFEHENFHYVKADVSSESDVNKAYNETVELIGIDISILINNAGMGVANLFEETSFSDWKRMFDVNVHGIFLCTQKVIPQMKIKDSGHIINIGSIAGTGGIEYMSGYCGTKFAVRGISQSMYKELRKFGIKVTCINPGSVKTSFFDDIPQIEANDNMMRPEDIAETILHVLKSSANYHHTEIEVRPLKPKG